MFDGILICGGHGVAISICSGTSVLSFCSFRPLAFIGEQLQIQDQVTEAAGTGSIQGNSVRKILL